MPADGRNVLKEFYPLTDTHVKYIEDTFSFIFDFQRLAVVPLALADLARHVDIRQEMHFDLNDAVASAGLAAAAPDVETEATLFIATQLRLRQAREQVTDIVEHAGIGRRIGTRRSADRRLVDVDDLVDVLQSEDRVMFARFFLQAVRDLRRPFIQDLVDQAALARTGNPGHADKLAQREFHVDILEIVRSGTLDDNTVTVARPPLIRHIDLLRARQILPGQGFLAVHDILHGALRDQFAAVNTRARSDVHDMVCRVHGILIVLDYHQGIADVRQVPQGLQQLFIVLLVQADARLVKNIEHAHQPGTDLCGQTDPLRFAARERSRAAAQCQVVQSHIDQELQSGLDLLDDLMRDHRVLFAEFDAVDEIQRLADRQIRKLRDVLPADRHGQDLRFETLAAAVRTGLDGHILFHLILKVLRGRLTITPLDIIDCTLERSILM